MLAQCQYQHHLDPLRRCSFSSICSCCFVRKLVLGSAVAYCQASPGISAMLYSHNCFRSQLVRVYIQNCLSSLASSQKYGLVSASCCVKCEMSMHHQMLVLTVGVESMLQHCLNSCSSYWTMEEPEITAVLRMLPRMLLAFLAPFEQFVFFFVL